MKPIVIFRAFFGSVVIFFCANTLVFSQDQAKSKVASTGLEEVVVTARRRRESLQETPLAVTAFSGQELKERGISRIGELTKSVPSVEILESTSNVIYIRGIGQRSAYARVDPTVGVYLDNIFLPRADGQLMDTVDVENVQVLRGPQGTLFGKNTTGGAMVLTLEKPSADKEAYVFGSLGNYGHHSFRAALNQPVSDTLFSRVAVSYLKDDGYIRDRSQGQRNASKGRISAIGQLRWEAGENILVDALVYAGKINERLPSVHCQLINEDNALLNRGLFLMWEGDTDPANPTAYRENCLSNSKERLGDLRTNLGPKSFIDRTLDTYLASSTVEWAMSDSTAFKLVASARDETIGPITSSDQDGGPMNFSESFNSKDGVRSSYSLELQINGSYLSDRLEVTAGLFGMRESNTEEFALINALNGIDTASLGQLAAGQQPTRPTGNGTTPQVGILVDPIVRSDFGLESQTLAVYAQSSWSFTEQTELTLGIRWTEETRESELTVRGSDRDAIAERIVLSGQGFGPSVEGFHQYNGPLGWLADPVGLAMSLFPDADGNGINDFPESATPLREDQKRRIFRKITPMASLSYQLPDDLMPGWMSSMMAYGTWSSGFKSGFFEPKGVDGLVLIEPEEVENREIGLKIEAFQRSLRFNMAIYDMDFENQQLIQVDTDSSNSLVVIYQNAGESSIRGVELEMQWMPVPGVMLNLSASSNRYRFTDFSDNDLLQSALMNPVRNDRSDERFPISPEKTLAFGVQFDFDSPVGPLTSRLDYSYKSEIYYGLDDGAYTAYQQDPGNAAQEAYALVDTRLTWRDEDNGSTLTAYVKNLLDKRYDIGVAAVGDSTGTYFQADASPRQFGLEYRREF